MLVVDLRPARTECNETTRNARGRNHALLAAKGVSELSQAQNAPVLRLEEVVITGSRLAVDDDVLAAPLTIFDRTRIDELGVTTTSELLRYLPQVSPKQ